MTDRMEKIIAAGEADHEAVRMRERAAVVAWLRDRADDASEDAVMGGIASEMARALELMVAAKHIERGDHIKPATDGGKE
jgi:hypothetical protein